MNPKRVTAQRRADRTAAKKSEDAFRPGRGRQPGFLTRPLHRTDGVMALMAENGNRDDELWALEHVWNHPRMMEIRAFLDGEEAGWAASYKWGRSQLFFPYIVSLRQGGDLKKAYTTVRTDADVRRIGGFAPRPPDAAERERAGEPQRRTDPAFPLLQSVSDFMNRWLAGGIPASRDPQVEESFVREQPVSERGGRYLAVVEQATQEIAFEAILKYDLDMTRLATDFSIVLSAQSHDRPCRTDYGAGPIVRDTDKEKKRSYGRLLGSVILVDCPFAIYSDIAYWDSEKTMLKESLLPGAKVASQRLVEFAADHGITSLGFHKALMCGDGQFQDHPDIEATFAHGFLPGYNVGGDKLDVIGSRLLKTTSGEEKLVELRGDGGLLCMCKTSRSQPTRKPMPRRIVVSGRSARVTCPYCATTYHMTPRGPDTKAAGGEPGDIDLRYDITVPRWDERVIAISFKARNLMEGVHSALGAMSLLPNGRGGKDWRPITGDFRHRFWYGLGYLLWNMTVEYNLDRKDVRHEYTCPEGFAAFLRNRHAIDRQRRMAELLGRRSPAPPRYRRKGKETPLVARPLAQRREAKLGTAPTQRAALHRTRRTRPTA